MAIQIQFRRGTAAQWASANTTLAQGELGLEIDTSYYKIGDGITPWTNLIYAIAQQANNSFFANNAYYLGGLISTGYQTTNGLAANVVTLAANSATYLGGNTAATLRTYTDDRAANAYSNSVSYVETQISGKIATSITANSATAYTNAVNIASADASQKAGAAISYTDARIGTVNNAIISNSSAAYTNSVSYTDTRIGVVNTAITANSATAYSNAVSYVTGQLYVNSSQLSSNLSNYQTIAGLSANVATLTSNSTSYVGTVSAANVVSNSQLTSNLANYGTLAGEATRVLGMTANSTNFVGTVSAANVVSNTQLSSNLANYGTLAGEATRVLGMTANNTSYVGTVSAANVVSNAQLTSNLANYVSTTNLTNNLSNYQTTAGLSANVATLTSNNTSYVGTVTAANVVSNSQLSSNLANYVSTTNLTNNLSNYQTTAGLSGNVATLTANNSTYLNGQLAAYYTNATNISTGTIAESRLPYRLNQNLTTTNNVTFANISLTGGTLSTLPVSPSDIVNKQYADAIASGVNFHPAVRLSTTVTFDATTATYNNGTNGVNATITDNSPYVAISLDGVTAAYGDRVLMRTVSNTAWNGVYVVSNTGSASYPWILTRSFDYDQVGSGTNEIDQGDLIYVLAGSSLAGTSWVQQNNITTIGTDGISFVQFSSKALYPLTEGTGLYYSVGGAYDGSAASTLAVNSSYIATLSSNNAAYLGGVAAASYQLNSTLSSNVVNLTANLANYIIANTGLISNSSGVFVNTAYISSIISVNANTANNALYLGGTIASGYQTTAGLSANVATLSSNNASYLGGVAAALYTNTSGNYTITGIHTHTANLVVNSSIIAGGNSGTVGQVLTSNGAGNVYWSSLSANLVVRSTNGNGGTVNTTVTNVTGINFDESTGLHVTDQGSGNVFVSLGSGYKYITVAGQTTITAVGEDTLNIANGSYITLTTSNTAPKTLTIAANLSSFQTTAGLASNVATLTANAATYLNGKTESNLNVNSSLTSNSSSYIGTLPAANVVSNSQLSSNLANYQTTAGLSSNVATLSANNSSYLGGVAAASYVNSTGSYTISGVHTYNANIVLNAGLSVNSSYGTAGQVLTSNGTTVYWAATGAGSFTNGQSISVANLVITGSVTANSSTGTAGQVLTSNGTATYWAAAASSVTAANATSQSFTGDGTTTTFTLTNSVANQTNIIVSLNGLLQIPTTHYTISGTALSFTTAPYTGAIIEARSMEGVVISGGSGSVSASITITPKSTAYTLQASDNGGMVSITTGGVTVPSGVLSSGMNVTIYNNSASNQTIIQGTSTTMYLAGATTPTTGNRTLGPYGLATIISVGTDTFTISGPGVS